MQAITVELRIFMTFRRYLPAGASDGRAQVTLAGGATFEDLLKRIGLPVREPKLFMINGRTHREESPANRQVLADGDVIAIFPPIGGG